MYTITSNGREVFRTSDPIALRAYMVARGVESQTVPVAMEVDGRRAHACDIYLDFGDDDPDAMEAKDFDFEGPDLMGNSWASRMRCAA